MQTSDPYDQISANPYASPPSVAAYESVDTGQIWRDGSILLMHKLAALPDVCIKSNEKTDGYRLKRNLTWHHPAITISLLISPVIYIILAAIVSKKATVYIGLSERWRKKRRIRIIIGWTSFFAGIALFGVGAAIVSDASTEGLGITLLLAGMSLPVIGGLYSLISARMISPKHIDDQYLQIKGAHPDFLAQFPQVGMPQPNVPQKY